MSSGAPSDASGPAQPSARWSHKLLLVLFGLLLPLVLLALIEGALALTGAGDDLRYEDPFVGFAPGRDVFSQRELPSGERVWSTNPDRLAFFNPQQFPVEKAPGTTRIFALGGSTTAGRPYDHRVAFPRWLELRLSELDPSRRWEVINAGAISYASYRIAVLMRELVRYRPDLFVLYTGHNEFLEERTYEGVLRADPGVRRLRVWLSGRRFYALARHAWLDLTRDRSAELPELAAEVETKLDAWTGLERYHRDEELERQVIEHFGWNLDRIVALARDAGAEVILVQPVSNLKDFSPFKSEHSDDFPTATAGRFDALLAEARQALADGAPETALPLLTEAAALDPLFADLHFRRGRALLALERIPEAEAAFVRAKDLDVAPLRALEPLVAQVAETARLRGLPLVELPVLLAAENRRLTGHPILGDELLLDHVHPDIPVHRRIAEEIAAVLVERGIARPTPTRTEAEQRVRWREIYERETAALDREYYARRDLNLAKVLGWAGKYEEAEPPLRRAAAVLPEEPEVHFNLGVLLQRTGRPEEAESELRRALDLVPALPEAWFNLGVVLGKQGRNDEAVAALERALELRPEYPEARHNLGVLLGEGGRLGEAVEALETAVREAPEAAETHARLGVAYRRQGRLERAEEELLRSLELDPSDAGTWTELGVTRVRRERFEAAVAAFRQALRRDPGHAEAHYNLGVLAARRGRPEEALAAYRKAVAADPGHARAHNNLGILLVQQGRLEEGREELEAAVGAEPGYAEAWFNLGVALDNLGRPDRALEALRRAVELDPDEPRFHYGLGMVLQARGRSEEARPHLEKAGMPGAGESTMR